MVRAFIFIGLFMANLLFSELPIKAIIFDCDGTLVDSEEAHLSAWRRTLQNRGHDLTLEQCLLYTGKPASVIAELIAETIGCSCSDEILAEKRAYYRELHQQGLPPIEATVDFLKRLANEKERLGFKLGVASAAIKSEILSNLRFLGIEELFDIILSGQDDLKHYADPEGVNKPKPYIYLHAMKKLGVFPAECVVIEDSSTGVNSGVSAGCFTIAIPNIYTRDQDLSNAHLRIESFADINVDHFFQMIGGKNNEINHRITDVVQGFSRQTESSQRRYIITGGPGSGKTAIVNDLAKRGYLITREAATDVIEEGLQQNIEAPWMADDYHIKVSSLMAKKQEEIRNSKETVAFFDRGHLDGITYILLQRRKLPSQVIEYVQAALNEGFFDKKVFFIENLGFCEQAPNRTETLKEALEKARHIKQNYAALGYQIVSIPPGTIEQRSEWIIEQIQQHENSKGPELPLATPRLTLRDFIQEDIPEVIAIASHSEFSGYLRFNSQKPSHDVTCYIEEAIEAQKPDLITGQREIFRLAIGLKEDPAHVIGCCVFHGWNKSPKDNDQIGYFIHPEHQGRGYATEALSYLLTSYFFQHPNRNVEAIVHPNNTGSQKVLKKMGFLRVGEKNIDVHGIQEPRLIYSVSAPDFERAIKILRKLQ